MRFSCLVLQESAAHMAFLFLETIPSLVDADQMLILSLVSFTGLAF